MTESSIVKATLDTLIQVPESRRSDDILTLEVYRRLGVNIHDSFYNLMVNGELSTRETVTRVRRKLQQHFPELRNISTATRRKCREEAMREWAVNTGRKELDNEYHISQ